MRLQLKPELNRNLLQCSACQKTFFAICEEMDDGKVLAVCINCLRRHWIDQADEGFHFRPFDPPQSKQEEPSTSSVENEKIAAGDGSGD